jgi:hypothetical protein
MKPHLLPALKHQKTLDDLESVLEPECKEHVSSKLNEIQGNRKKYLPALDLYIILNQLKAL